MIDLHSHTTASDGRLTPEALVQAAAGAGITVLAVTDHDTVAGLAAATAAATQHGLRLVPGIEITTLHHGREIHVLGHFVDPAEPALLRFDEALRIERAERMDRMVAKLRSFGFPVSIEHVRRVAGDAHLGRPHLARVLVDLGYVADVRDAFDRYLGDGKAAAVPRFEVSVAEAIGLIHGAGGTATVAHPGVSRVNRLELAEFRALGLDGLEVAHSDHPPSQREKLLELALGFDLVPTAGSDFHGLDIAKDRRLGTMDTGAQNLARLEARRPSRQG